MRERTKLIKSMRCIACQLRGVYNQPGETEEHHLNLGGKAGQKRRGHEYTVPLCTWHHRGIGDRNVDSKAMTALYGPSLARQPRLFREVFGTDDELLALTNEKLEAA